jgi:hypothetical protein
MDTSSVLNMHLCRLFGHNSMRMYGSEIISNENYQAKQSKHSLSNTLPFKSYGLRDSKK